MELDLKKMGNSTALVLPPPVLKSLGVAAGSTLSVEVEDGRIVLTPKRDTLQALVDQCSTASPPVTLEAGDILRIDGDAEALIALVVTRRPYHRLGETLVAPVTTQDISANAGFAVPLTGCATAGYALVNQLRSINLAAVNATRIEQAPASVSQDARRRLSALLE